MQQQTATQKTNLDVAADLVRRHKAELDNAETTYNFHTKMAATAFDEVKKHKRNLTTAQEHLAKVAASPSSGAGASVIAPKPQPTTLIQGR